MCFINKVAVITYYYYPAEVVLFLVYNDPSAEDGVEAVERNKSILLMYICYTIISSLGKVQ